MTGGWPLKKSEGGKFSTWANDTLKPEDVVEVMAPEGNFFTEVAEGQSKSYVAFAAGSGITPVISILKTVLAVEKGSSFTLYYGNRNAESIIFRDQLDELKAEYGDRLSIVHVLSREEGGDAQGRIEAAKCDELSEQNAALYAGDEYFLCGPESMIFSVKEKLEGAGVESGKIHFELFTTPVAEEQAAEGEMPDIEAEVTVIIDGEDFTYPLSSTGDSILDASMDAGADVPFSCKGAVCCTCRAKVTEGKVHMDMNYALTDQEVEEGYVLTCQSHPITDKVVVDYDQD